MSKEKFVVDAESGIKIAADLADHNVDLDELVANTWNPNRMDPFMRRKLETSIRKDGFIIPIIVRPHPKEDGKYEIVDGEHRWQVAKDELKMGQVPILDLGSISDEQAKEITIKANTLRGEFDSIELGKIVKDLVESQGMDDVAESLPYTPERLQGMIDLLVTDIGDMEISDEEDEVESDEKEERSKSSSDFDSYDPSEAKFDHQCPRCGFEFNNTKGEKDETTEAD